MLTVKQISEQLKLSENTVLKLIHRGEIKALKAGKQYRIQLEDLHSYIRVGISSRITMKKILLRTDQNHPSIKAYKAAIEKARCLNCGELMKPVKDKITNEITGYLWTCKCMPDKIVSIG